MKKLLLFVMAISLVGCATMRQRVFKNIHEGDSKEVVLKLLGEPDVFKPAEIPGATAWWYAKQADVCGFAIKDEKVVKMGCMDNPNHVSPGAVLGSALKGMGDGMKEAGNSNRRVSCTTNQYGATAYTDCQ